MSENLDVRVIPSIGHQFVSLSDQFLIDNLGRPYTVPELAQFAETVVSTLIASAYTNFRDAFGKEGAEEWLKRTLGHSTAGIRRMGAEALVKFEVEIKEMPNALYKQRQAAETKEAQAAPSTESAPAPEIKCTCKLSTEGSCFSCIRTLSGIYKGTFQWMRQMSESEKKAEEMCQVCRATQTDQALASVVPDALAIKVPEEKKGAFRQGIQVMLQQLAGANGATALPLTEQAWKEAVDG